jgi:hypothetical protein
MTETQTPNHGAPLAPGEIRTHTVGTQTFQVMHVSGGSFTQAKVRRPIGDHMESHVLCTSRFDSDAVRAYADAIAAAEDAAAAGLDDADGLSFDASGNYLDGDGEDWAPAYAESAADAALSYNLPDGADSALVRGEHIETPTLRELLDAYSEATARAAYHVALGGLGAARRQIERAAALKAEIVKRFDRPAGDR